MTEPKTSENVPKSRSGQASTCASQCVPGSFFPLPKRMDTRLHVHVHIHVFVRRGRASLITQNFSIYVKASRKIFSVYQDLSLHQDLSLSHYNARSTAQ